MPKFSGNITLENEAAVTRARDARLEVTQADMALDALETGSGAFMMKSVSALERLAHGSPANPDPVEWRVIGDDAKDYEGWTFKSMTSAERRAMLDQEVRDMERRARTAPAPAARPQAPAPKAPAVVFLKSSPGLAARQAQHTFDCIVRRVDAASKAGELSANEAARLDATLPVLGAAIAAARAAAVSGTTPMVKALPAKHEGMVTKMNDREEKARDLETFRVHVAHAIGSGNVNGAAATKLRMELHELEDQFTQEFGRTL